MPKSGPQGFQEIIEVEINSSQEIDPNTLEIKNIIPNMDISSKPLEEYSDELKIQVSEEDDEDNQKEINK